MAAIQSLSSSEQLQKLNWNFTLNLTGEKVPDPDIHCCEICDLPILIYGRMLPCKHVFCYDCASKADKFCPRCKDAVSRMERCDLGTIFLCTFGAPRNSHEGCRRTYLSQRDLQAHTNHRHTSKTTTATKQAAAPDNIIAAAVQKAVPAPVPRPPPIMNNASRNNNLITIQLQAQPTTTSAVRSFPRGNLR